MKRIPLQIYRRRYRRWYDSDRVCRLVILLMAPPFLFGIAGISVARNNPQFQNFLWVPMTMAAGSGLVAVKTAIRMVRRRLRRKTEEP